MNEKNTFAQKLLGMPQDTLYTLRESCLDSQMKFEIAELGCYAETKEGKIKICLGSFMKQALQTVQNFKHKGNLALSLEISLLILFC